MKKVLFVTHEGFSSTIFQSQVLEHCSYLGNNFKESFEVDILTFEVFHKNYQSSKSNKDVFFKDKKIK
jgi:hypothetical protein